MPEHERESLNWTSTWPRHRQPNPTWLDSLVNNVLNVESAGLAGDLLAGEGTSGGEEHCGG